MSIKNYKIRLRGQLIERIHEKIKHNGLHTFTLIAMVKGVKRMDINFQIHYQLL